MLTLKAVIDCCNVKSETTMIIVTGGAGFIGSALIAELNTRGIDDVLIVDILLDSHKFTLGGFLGRAAVFMPFLLLLN